MVKRRLHENNTMFSNMLIIRLRSLKCVFRSLSIKISVQGQKTLETCLSKAASVPISLVHVHHIAASPFRAFNIAVLLVLRV